MRSFSRSGLGAVTVAAMAPATFPIVVAISPRDLAGKGTGLVLLGFLLVPAIGPPAAGFSVNVLGTHGPGRLTAAIVFIVSGLIAFKIPAGSTLADRRVPS